MSYTVVSHVIEYSRDDGKTWETWGVQPDGDWRKLLPGASHRGKLVFRLVKREAVITDEVLDEEPVMSGECSVCGRKGVRVTRLPGGDELLKFRCTDPVPCNREYRRVTEDEGWLW